MYLYFNLTPYVNFSYKDLDKIFKILNKNKYDKRKRPAEEEDDDEEEDEEVLKVMEIYKKMMKEALKEVVKCYNEKLYNETGEILDANIDKVLLDYIAYSKSIYGVRMGRYYDI